MKIALEHLLFDGVGPFREEARFDLEADGATFVYAPNGHGKTSTIDLTRWLIRGRAAIENNAFRSLKCEAEKNVINHHRFRNMKGGRAEAILLVEGRGRYRIERDLPFGTSPSSTLTIEKENDGSWEAIEDPEGFLEAILPHERIGFNLLTGEHVKEFVEELSGPKVKRSVERLLQNPEVVSMHDALAEVQAAYEAEADEEARIERRRLKLLEKRSELKERVESFQNEARERENEEAKVQTKIEELNQELASLEDLDDLQAERDLIQTTIQDLQRRQRREVQACAQILTPSWQDLLKAAGAQPVNQLLERHENATRELADWQRSMGAMELLEAVLHEEACNCGRELDAPSRKKIEAQVYELQREKPQVPELPVDAWTLRSWATSAASTELVTELTSHRERLTELTQDLADRQERLDEIDQTLEETDPDQERRIERKLKSAKMKIRSIREERQKAERNAMKAQKELNKTKEKLADTVADPVDSSMLRKARAYTKALRTVIDRALPALREELLERTQEIFDQLFQKESEFQIVIREHSMVPDVIHEVDGEEQPALLSEGEKTRVGMALLFALREVASEHPFLLLDAPFSTLDDEGVYRLLELIRDHDGQVVVFTKNAFPDGQWYDAVAAAKPRVYQMDWVTAGPRDREGFTQVTETDVSVLRLQGGVKA